MFRILAPLCALALATSAHAQNLDAQTPADLLPQAKQEGKVTVYAFTSRIARVEKAFEAAYPGIDMVTFDMSSTEQIARIKSEAQANLPGADVIYISDAPVVLTELVASNLISPYVPPRVAGVVAEQFKSPLLAQRLSTKVLMYNEEAHPEGSPVKNLWDLTKPDWKGRVIIVDPLQRGDYLDLMTEIVLKSDEMAAAYQTAFGKPITLGSGSENAGQQFIADLFANDLVLVGSTDDVNKAVGAKGQAKPPIGFTSYSDRRDNEDEGWALQVANDVTPSNGIVFPAFLALNPKPANPAAARLAIDFMMGDDSETGGDGFKPFYVAGDWPTRSDITPHKDAIALADFNGWQIAPAETAKIRAEVADFILALQ
ncbi:ABC transporter substrate-binding protein [Agrobacterium rubi]|uniref:Putative ABC transporter substrate-binding protein n=1 Tax=Agrobacterium rubi TR3 = NBRC 13261 TaxID=1368415 RepID=A0A081D1T1_9HYPH|nr:ABC transporter substrate-binding protein [Agrobacterium rubi]MBP1881174.1 iron(III) transport system substrate-binding protein [Agrobacterium rubi]MCL6654533.1 iron ABC transporter substrate-binding protein [Agrobacterium rubi]NTF09292.1 ABC transporter substrate-binding protein [Agrobacterium rubi]NTF22201.1 ABC transporter substrate-binding protein [Agrobacterium rubi]NTF29058.1 ABC transporter substrate-binding protein [Agrobacterium rubi]